MAPAPDESLEALLARLAAGDRDAFEPAFHRLWPLLRAFAARHVLSHEAEDVAQSALLKLFARSGEYDPRRPALPWALGIVAWEVRTHLRRRQRHREESHAEDRRACSAPSPEAQLLQDEQSALLDRALGSLSPSDASALLAHARGERPAGGGATFRQRLRRALLRLRASLGSEP